MTRDIMLSEKSKLLSFLYFKEPNIDNFDTCISQKNVSTSLVSIISIEQTARWTHCGNSFYGGPLEKE
jgi:hypothetical protein